MRFFRGRGPCGGRASPIGRVRNPVLALGRALPAERPRQYIGSGVGNILPPEVPAGQDGVTAWTSWTSWPEDVVDIVDVRGLS